MAENEIKVPDFQFTGMYYPQILRMLRQYRRVNVPEITSEDDHEPFEQLLRAYSLASHISNVLCDLIALEAFIPTAQLLSSVRDHLRLIDYRLSQATPSQVPALLELARVFTAATLVVPAPTPGHGQFSTERTESQDEIIFEYLTYDGLTVERTDQFGACFVEERTTPLDPSTASWTDRTTEINDQTGTTFTPWTTPAQNDAIYFGHPGIMWDRLDIKLATAGSSSGIQGVWEFYDGDYKDANPDTVENLGPNLKFTINSFLGALNRSGASIRVTYLPTGAYEDVWCTFDGTYNTITTTGLLGQTTTPSSDPNEYSVGSLWNPLPAVVDESNNMQQSGKLTYTLPQTTTLNWIAGEINSKTQYWIRYRIVTVTSPTSPTIDYARLDMGKQYVLVVATQGRNVSDEPLGSSNGLGDQVFTLKQKPMIDQSLTVLVDGVEWTQVEDLLSSGAQDKHYTVAVGDDDIASITFGDGTFGAIPAMGVNNIAAYYRIGGDLDGNIPAGSLTQNAAGLAYVGSITNPRPGTGWKVKDGGTDEDLARVKIAGPASLRTLGRAVAIQDVESIATDYITSEGSRPVARAYAMEEVYGPKTLEVICVGQGGNYLLDTQLAAFQEYLNGDPTAVPPLRGVLHANTQATVVNYRRHVINVVATVYGGVKTEIENAITALLSPLKLKTDGASYQWDFGGEVPMSVIIDAIHNVSDVIRKVTLVSPAADVSLDRRELPYPGTLSITVIA